MLLAHEPLLTIHLRPTLQQLMPHQQRQHDALPLDPCDLLPLLRVLFELPPTEAHSRAFLCLLDEGDRSKLVVWASGRYLEVDVAVDGGDGGGGEIVIEEDEVHQWWGKTGIWMARKYVSGVVGTKGVQCTKD